MTRRIDEPIRDDGERHHPVEHRVDPGQSGIDVRPAQEEREHHERDGHVEDQKAADELQIGDGAVSPPGDAAHEHGDRDEVAWIVK